jgi:hypothetical protein
MLKNVEEIMLKAIKTEHELKIILIIFLLFLLNGCLGDPSEENIRIWLKESVSECDGTVNKIMVIREEFLSNKFVGYAEVSIKGKKYYPDVVVYADHKGQAFYTMPRNPCSQSVVEDLGESLSNLFD